MQKQKPCDQMTAAELGRATRQYDEPFAALRESKPLTPAMRRKHRQAAKRARARISKDAAKLSIRMERRLLERADRFAKSHGLTRSELIASGVRAIVGSAA